MGKSRIFLELIILILLVYYVIVSLVYHINLTDKGRNKAICKGNKELSDFPLELA
jgi:hypothetical protein